VTSAAPMPYHPPVWKEEDRAGPVRAQRPAHRRPRPASLRRAAGLARRPRLLRPAPRPRRRSPPALRQLEDRLVGILHGCLKTSTKYDEDIAWPQPQKNYNLLLDRQTSWDACLDLASDQRNGAPPASSALRQQERRPRAVVVRRPIPPLQEERGPGRCRSGRTGCGGAIAVQTRGVP
jgi:hypothetical protein